LYAYSDETGQDTQGQFFLVATVIAVGARRDELVEWLEITEEKCRTRRGRSRAEKRLDYLDSLLFSGQLDNSVFYSKYMDTRAYRECTITSIARALDAKSPGRDYQADIVVDGLTRTEIRLFATDLRGRGIPAARIRGARDESSVLVRVAHEMVKLVREAEMGTGGEASQRFKRALGRVVVEA